MKTKYIAPVIFALAFAAILIMPTLALRPETPGKGPKYEKWVAPLLYEDVRYGQVIFNINPEDDGKFELEVEVEECMDLASSTVEVYLDGEPIGTIDVDEFGNGKATFYVESISTDDTVTVIGAITLESGAWHQWAKIPSPK